MAYTRTASTDRKPYRSTTSKLDRQRLKQRFPAIKEAWMPHLPNDVCSGCDNPAQRGDGPLCRRHSSLDSSTKLISCPAHTGTVAHVPGVFLERKEHAARL